MLTPSHNPPEDGGYKYNPPSGGPADTSITKAIEEEANRLIEGGLADVQREPDPESQVVPHDYVAAYVDDLPNVIDIDAIRDAGVRIGADPLGGASVAYFQAITERLGLDVDVVNEEVDPTFRVHAARPRRQDPHGLLVAVRDGRADRPQGPLRRRRRLRPRRRPPRDRHAERGADEPQPLPGGRDRLPVRRRARLAGATGIGKTLVSSTMIDFVADALGRRLVEVPVGFKWFVEGLLDGSLGFGGEESAGASFLRRDGSPWSTDKDGILLALLAAEITATTGRDPGAAYGELTERFGAPAYRRVDSPVDPERKEKLLALEPYDITADELAGDTIEKVLTRAPGNDAPIGGVKVVSAGGWFAARPSGTEDIYKLYAESLRGEEHLEQIIADAREILG